MNKLKQCVVAVAALFGAVQAWAYAYAPGERVVNGGFETYSGTLNGSTWGYLKNGASLSNWSYSGDAGITLKSDGAWHNPNWSWSGYGNATLFLQAGTEHTTPAYVEQDVFFPVSGVYKFQMSYTKRPNYDNVKVTITVDGTQVWSRDVTEPTQAATGWSSASIGAGTKKLRITCTNSSGKDGAACLDCLTVTLQSYSGTVSCANWDSVTTLLAEGYSVKLAQNITQTSDQPNLNGSQNVTLDLNGKTIDRQNVSGNYWFMRTCSANATLTITDSSSGKTGKVLGNVSKSHGEYGNALRIEAGKMIINGGTFQNMYSSSGGGFAYVKSGTLEINGGTITGCKSGGNGGAIYGYSGTIKIAGGTISSCSAVKGGALYIADSTVTVTGGTISGCSASAEGGGVHSYYTFTFSGGTIYNCSAPYGGGIYNRYPFYLNGGTIQNCTASTSGGGVYNTSTFTMNSGTITGNKTTSGCGGGVYNTGSSATFTMNGGTISSNTAGGTSSGTGNGGGISIESSGTVTINGGSVINNTANRYAAGVFNNGGKLRVYNCTITGNKASTGDGGGIETDGTDDGTTSTIIYGAVVTGNSANNGHKCLFADCTSSQNTTVYGGVFDVSPSTVSYIACASGYASTQVGSYWVVGKDVTTFVSTTEGKTYLKSGSFTFNPSASPYSSYLTLTPFTSQSSGTSYTLTCPTLSEPLSCSTWAQVCFSLRNSFDTVLSGNVTQNSQCTIPENAGTMTLDMNGKTIYCGTSNYRAFLVYSGNTLAITNGTFNGNSGSYSVSYDGTFMRCNGGNVTLADVTVKNCKPSSTCCGALYLPSGTLTMKGGALQNCTVGGNGGGAYVGSSGTFVMTDGAVIENCTSTYAYGGGGAVYVTGGTFKLEDGIIRSCTASVNGGGVYVYSGTMTMDGGTITNCTAATHGGGVYNAKTFTMNGGTIAGNKTTSGCGAGVYNTGSSAAFTLNGGTVAGNTAGGTAGGTGLGGGMYNAGGATAEIYGGSIVDNVANRYGGGVFTYVSRLRVYGGTITGNEAKNNDGGGIQTDSVVDGANSTIIYGGVITGNKANSGHNCLFANQTTSQNTTVYGGVFDVDPATVSYIGCASGYASTAYGSNNIVGKNVAQADSQITGGTYVFCPTNAEYVAAGVAVAPWVDMTDDETTDPKTWTIADGTTAIVAGDTAKARIKGGVCWITGTGSTLDDKPLDSQWASVKEVRITDGVEGVGTYFFDRFYNLTNVTVSASCKTLGAGAFYRCHSLEQITFEGEMPEMGENALVITAGIRMEGGNPVVYAVPNVTVNGKDMALKGKVNLTDAEWQTVTPGEEGNYHFFKFVAGD